MEEFFKEKRKLVVEIRPLVRNQAEAPDHWLEPELVKAYCQTDDRVLFSSEVHHFAKEYK